jgi:hypothetical protein
MSGFDSLTGYCRKAFLSFLSSTSVVEQFIMSVRLFVITARNGNPTLTIKGENAAEVYAVAGRVNRWLTQTCPGFTPYLVPAYRDKVAPDLFYSPVPLLVGTEGFVSCALIAKLVEAMDKAGLDYSFDVLDERYVAAIPQESEEIDDLVNPFDGMNLAGMSKSHLVKLAKEHGVRIGSRFTKAQVIESLQDHLVAVPLS